jgi:hypothetical protein
LRDHVLRRGGRWGRSAPSLGFKVMKVFINEWGVKESGYGTEILKGNMARNYMQRISNNSNIAMFIYY